MQQLTSSFLSQGGDLLLQGDHVALKLHEALAAEVHRRVQHRGEHLLPGGSHMHRRRQLEAVLAGMHRIASLDQAGQFPLFFQQCAAQLQR